MPDLDFDGLRDKLHGSVTQPPVDTVVARARQRQIRRRLQLVTVVTVVLAVAVVPLLRLGVQRNAATPATTADQNFLVSMDFYDITAGFVLGGSCVHRPRCEPWLMVTTNGVNWEKRTPPPVETGSSGKADRLMALSSTTVLVEDHLPGNAVKRYISDDGAKSWREVPTAVSGTLERFAGYGLLECRDGVVGVVQENGLSARLATQPPIDVTACQPYPDLHKNRWVIGRDRQTGRPAVAKTREGEMWQVSPLPTPTGSLPGNPAVSIITSPTAVYATVTDPGDTPAGLVAIFRSTDSGLTWQQTWQAAEGKEPSSISGVPVAGTDGKLRVAQYRRYAQEIWVSDDGGRTFTTQPALPADVEWIRTGYLAKRDDGRYETSYDGVSWKRVELPSP